MQGTAILASCATHVLEGVESPPPQGPNPQLSSGPTHVLKGRPRTGPDDSWLKSARTEAQEYLSDVPSIRDRTDLAVLERVSWLSSCNDDRAFFGSVDGLAAYLRMGRRTAQRSLSRWEARGVFEFRRRKGGRPSQSSRGRFNVLVLKLGQHGRLNPATVADRFKSTKIQEGRADQNLNLLTCEAQSKGVTAPASTATDPDIHLKGLPSPGPGQDQGQEKASAPVAEEPRFEHPRQVAKLYALQRKLNYRADDNQAEVFDGLEHVEKKRILDRLEAEEQQAAIRGEVANPPPKTPALRHVPPVARSTPKPTRERTGACREHRWTPPAEDGIASCVLCGEERGQLRVVLYDDDTHFTSSPLKKGQGNCRHVWAAPDEERVSVCGICGEERLVRGGSD